MTNSTALPGNVKRFIAFRILFNARFYYPVFAVLFLDMGLTAEEFALINVVWAVTIIVLEVPSGAIADQIGRKWTVVVAAFLMLAEMVLIAFVPLGNHAILLGALVINRILSGAAEAAASGADEALAYDTLAEAGRSSEWPDILRRLMSVQAIAFVLTSIIGAVVYDAGMLSKAAEWLNLNWSITPAITLRFPLYLTLLSSLGVIFITLGMTEPNVSGGSEKVVTLRETNRRMLDAARWILTSPLALVLITAGVLYDSVIRLFLTFGATYYRLIQIPEAYFGLLGSAFAILGFFVSGWGQVMVRRWSMGRNLPVVAAVTMIGLVLLAAAIPYFGALALIPLGVGFFLNNFFLSHYLNELVDSSHRATVLSFKGLAMNLAYAALGLAFAGVLRHVKQYPEAAGWTDVDLSAFGEAVTWLPGYFAGAMVVLALFAWMQKRRIPTG